MFAYRKSVIIALRGVNVKLILVLYITVRDVAALVRGGW